MGTHRLSEPFVCAVSKQYQERFVTSVEHLGKISNLQNKQMKKIIQDNYSIQEKQKDRQERTPHQNRQISLILGRTFSYFERV